MLLNYKNLFILFLLLTLIIENSFISFPFLFILSILFFVFYPQTSNLFIVFFISIILDFLKVSSIGITPLFVLIILLTVYLNENFFDLRNYKFFLLFIFIALIPYSYFANYSLNPFLFILSFLSIYLMFYLYLKIHEKDLVMKFHKK